MGSLCQITSFNLTKFWGGSNTPSRLHAMETLISSSSVDQFGPSGFTNNLSSCRLKYTIFVYNSTDITLLSGYSF